MAHRHGRLSSGVWIKRVLDVAVALVAIAVTAPLWLVVALAIKLTSRGPVLFRHNRVGQNGELFTMLKFRSMRPGVDSTALARSGDPRITPIGKLLRKVALDEWPQLVNVVLGDMSIVGPRPALPEMVSFYENDQKSRLDVRPGLTGWAQVNGRNSLPYHERLDLDVWYVKHQSLWLDFKITLKTVPVMFSSTGLYQEETRPWERRPKSSAVQGPETRRHDQHPASPESGGQS